MIDRKLNRFILALGFAISIAAAPSFAQDEKPNDEPKSEQVETSKDEEKEKRPEPQSRTGTNKLKRLKKLARNSDEMIKTMIPVTASASQSTAVVQSGEEQIALGTVVDSNGLILTKASQLDSKLNVWVAGKQYEAKVFGIHRRSDLAMLKIEAENLPVANFSQGASPQTGSWLASVGPDEEAFSLGTVGVNARKISATKAFVGIRSSATGDPENPGVKITQVVPDSPADKADLWVNDVIIKIADTDIKEFNDLQKTLGKFQPGDQVELTIKRGDEELKVNLELADAGNFNSDFERSNQQNRMGSELSRRRQDFPMAFQHDCGLNANQCGGPIVDLSGQVVGINIARAERVSSLAIPANTVLEVVERLKTGELSPSVINKMRLAEADRKIARLREDLIGLPGEKDALARVQDIEQARLEELKKMKEDVQDKFEKMIADLETEMKEAMGSVDDRISELSKEAKSRQVELSGLKKKIVTYKRKIKKLEQAKEDLMSGVGE